MIKIREVNDLKEAEALWRALSPNETIFDEWDFRYCFYKYTSHPLCFLAAYENDELVGLLPLQKHPEYGCEFFAEYSCEENRPFVKTGYDHIIPNLYAAMPGHGKAYDITGEDEFTSKMTLEDYIYILPLKEIKTFQDFLDKRLSAKRRRSLFKEIDEAEANKPEVKFITGPLEDKLAILEYIFKFNTGNFKEESYLLKDEQAPWRDLMSLDFNWRLAVIKIKGGIQAASLSVFHGGEWHYMITGVNFKEYAGLGKYLVKINIEAAIAAGAGEFNAGLGDCGWKHLWHFDKKPQYLFIKEA